MSFVEFTAAVIALIVQEKEEAIVAMFRRGEAVAMDKLYAAFSGYLYAICCRYIADDEVAKDVLQEVFIKAYTKIDMFQYNGIGSLKAWLRRIAINLSIEELRRQNAMRLAIEGMATDDDDSEPNTDGMNEEVLLELIRSLPQGYQTVFNLYVIEGYSHKEISEILDIKADTSASQYHKARVMLAKKIKEYKANAK